MYYTHTTFFFQSLLNAFNMCTLVITVPAIKYIGYFKILRFYVDRIEYRLMELPSVAS